MTDKNTNRMKTASAVTVVLFLIVILGVSLRMMNAPKTRVPLPPVPTAETPPALPITEESQQFLKFTETEMDFGRIYKGLSYKAQFHFENPSDSDVRITDLQTSCSCVNFMPDPPNVPPHSSGTIAGNVHFADAPGKTKETIVVKTDTDETHILQITADVVNKFIVEPNSVDWGEIYWDNSPSAEVVIRSDNDEPIPSSLDIMPGNISNLRIEVKERTEKQLVLSLNLDTPPFGLFVQHIMLKSEESVDPEIAIPVYAEVSGPVRTTPNSFYLGAIDSGKPVSCRLVCVTKPGSDTSIESVTFRDSDIPLNVKIAESDAGIEVAADFTPPKKRGMFKEFLVINTVNPDYKHYVEIVGFVEADNVAGE